MMSIIKQIVFDAFHTGIEIFTGGMISIKGCSA